MSESLFRQVRTVDGLTLSQRIAKRSFDVVVAAAGLVLAGWTIALAYVVASLDTGESGFFTQQRVGRNGKLFRVFKIRTMRSIAGVNTTVTTDRDVRLTRIGRFLRRTKIDELPQLLNVLKGDMSLVGPRPDVQGFADQLTGEDRIILSVRPGITGPATLHYRNEEQLLARQTDPVRHNREVLYPEKVRINRKYIQNYHFATDLKYIWYSILS